MTLAPRECSDQENRREHASAKRGAIRPDCTDFARFCSLFGSKSGLLLPFAFANISRSVLYKHLILLYFAGAGGENRTHDLPLTKGLRYHYATPASEGRQRPARPKERLLYPIVCVKGKGSWVPVSPKSPEQRERLAAALRENLKRRKVRTRALAETNRPRTSAAPEALGGETPAKPD